MGEDGFSDGYEVAGGAEGAEEFGAGVLAEGGDVEVASLADLADGGFVERDGGEGWGEGVEGEDGFGEAVFVLECLEGFEGPGLLEGESPGGGAGEFFDVGAAA